MVAVGWISVIRSWETPAAANCSSVRFVTVSSQKFTLLRTRRGPGTSARIRDQREIKAGLSLRASLKLAKVIADCGLRMTGWVAAGGCQQRKQGSRRMRRSEQWASAPGGSVMESTMRKSMRERPVVAG